jgi:hypothetical protein
MSNKNIGFSNIGDAVHNFSNDQWTQKILKYITTNTDKPKHTEAHNPFFLSANEMSRPRYLAISTPGNIEQDVNKA